MHQPPGSWLLHVRLRPRHDLSIKPGADHAGNRQIDMQGIEAALVKNELRKDPFTGTVFVFRSRKADRLKLIYWDGGGLMMAYKRLEDHAFTWPGIRDGLMTLSHAQFEALFAGLDWRRVRSVETRAPEAVE